jgi:hypothetical protein
MPNLGFEIVLLGKKRKLAYLQFIDILEGLLAQANGGTDNRSKLLSPVMPSSFE